MNYSDMGKLKIDLDRLGEWAVKKAMKINPGKSKAVSFTTARAEDSPDYFGGGTKISGSEQLQIFRNNHRQ